MKKYILVLVALISFTASQAQEGKTKKVQEINFKVNGVCGECKERLEENAMRLKGVKLAEWDKITHNMKVVFNTTKNHEDSIHIAMTKIGHETEKFAADSAAYQRLPKCCQYNDESVKSH